MFANILSIGVILVALIGAAPAEQRSQVPAIRGTGVTEYPASHSASPDHLPPLLGVVGDELSEVGRGAGKHRAA
jgi:hypothetical protein